MIRLWSINRWLRWAGFLLVIESDGRAADDPERQPTRLGFMFMGWPPDRKWAEHCARSKSRSALPPAPGDLGPDPEPRA